MGMYYPCLLFKRIIPMRITNTYLDDDKDAWWTIDVHVFFLTDELFQASESAKSKFDEWITTYFIKTEIGTKHD